MRERFTSRRDLVRLALGTAQMFGVVVSMTLLVMVGLSRTTLWAVTLTSASTAVSVLLFGGRHKGELERPRRVRR